MTSSANGPSTADVMSLALNLHRGGHLSEAEGLYRKVLQRDRSDVNALHFLGVLRHQDGDSEEAIRLIRSALKHNPTQAGARLNLGNILKETKRFDEAAREYGMVLEIDANNAQAHNNLGVVRRAAGKVDDAIVSLKRATAIDPDYADAHQNLGNALKSVGRDDEALDSFRTAVELEPKNATAQISYARALRNAGENDRAIAAYRQWLKIDPGNAIAEHLLAAALGENVPERCSEQFVREVFDVSSSNFEENIERLEYRLPAWVAETMRDLYGEPDSNLNILDAGCGTGLCGEPLRPFAKSLVGVDLSPKMLTKAKSHGWYDRLDEADLTGYMNDRPGQFDLINSADTFLYFGTLDHVFSAAAVALRQGGRLLFSLERLTDDQNDAEFHLQPNGRYSHRESFVALCLERAGFGVEEMVQHSVRLEMNRPVEGLLVTAIKENR